MSTVQWSGYLAVSVNRRGYENHSHFWKTSARLCVNKPTVSRDEVAVKISVDLPVSLFQRTSLEARISVPEHAVTPLEISMEAMDNIAEMIAQNTGFDVKLMPVDGRERA